MFWVDLTLPKLLEWEDMWHMVAMDTSEQEKDTISKDNVGYGMSMWTSKLQFWFVLNMIEGILCEVIYMSMFVYGHMKVCRACLKVPLSTLDNACKWLECLCEYGVGGKPISRKVKLWYVDHIWRCMPNIDYNFLK